MLIPAAIAGTALLVAGCATATADHDGDAGARGPAEVDSGAPTPDASEPTPDASEPTPDASATADPDAAPDPDAACTPAWINLLANGGFESGAAEWTTVGDVIDGTGTPFAPYAGTHHARLGGANNTDEQLTQTVAIPADATALRLRGYRCYVTSDTTAASDSMTIELRDTIGTVLHTLASYPNQDLDSVCSWNEFTLDAADAHAGQSIELSFRATTNPLSPTSWVLDALALEALSCP